MRYTGRCLSLLYFHGWLNPHFLGSMVGSILLLSANVGCGSFEKISP